MGNALCNGEHCSDCSRLAPVPFPEAAERLPGPDPAGAVFAETLNGLNDIDRQLLLFSASSNLAAVRWLWVLGADLQVADRNGTTCLHASCRSGSTSVVEALVLACEGVAGLQVADVSGWTPLHVAAFMGRPDAVSLLLRAGADREHRNSAGQLAADLCADSRTHQLLSSKLATSDGRQQNASTSTSSEQAVDAGAANSDLRSKDIHFEPFFVSRCALLKDEDLDRDLILLCISVACRIFERQPGRGLAFLVATGAARDRPSDLIGFMTQKQLSPRQIGLFLGEDFSISKILRMEFLNSADLLETGVVSALIRGLDGLQVPHDLQKLDRLLGSLAEIWWRQQRAGLASQEESGRRREGAKRPGLAAAAATEMESNEVQGSSLKLLVSSASTLHQLLFSSMMLHWNLHGPLPSSCRLSFKKWKALHADSRNEVPERLLEGIYTSLAQTPHYQLLLGSIDPSTGLLNSDVETLETEDDVWVEADRDVQKKVWFEEDAGREAEKEALPQVDADMDSEVKTKAETLHTANHGEIKQDRQLLGGLAQVQSWVRVSGDGLPSLHAESGTGYSEFMQMTGRVSEAPFSARGESARLKPQAKPSEPGFPPSGPGGATPLAQPHRLAPFALEAAWLSLCGPLLFFQSDPEPGASPHAFLHLKSPRLADIDPARFAFSLEEASSSLQMVLLLPDGRWQTCSIQKLIFQVCDANELKNWILTLAELEKKRGKKPHLLHI